VTFELKAKLITVKEAKSLIKLIEDKDSLKSEIADPTEFDLSEIQIMNNREFAEKKKKYGLKTTTKSQLSFLTKVIPSLFIGYKNYWVGHLLTLSKFI
jgi:hypothetical protein